MPQNIYPNWAKIVSTILNDQPQVDSPGEVTPQILTLETDALELMLEWNRENTDKCNDISNNSIKGVLSKFDIHIFRFCLIIQVMHDVCTNQSDNKVTLQSVQSAIKLSEYFANSLFWYAI